jgi:hypothetical protein
MSTCEVVAGTMLIDRMPHPDGQSMIPKSGNRFSERPVLGLDPRIMLQHEVRAG